MEIETSYWISGDEKNQQRVRVVEEGREGSIIFVRPLGEKEIDTGEKVKYDPEKQEQLILTTPIYSVSLHTTEEVGRKNDILTWVRVVPDGRDGSTVYARTLLPNELDTGLAVQLRPGDTFAFRPGKLVFSLEGVDASVATKFEDGYASITNTILTWLSLYPTLVSHKILSEEGLRYLLSLARRLDTSHENFALLHSKLQELKTVENGIQERTLTADIIGLLETGIIALNRALQMANDLGDYLQLSTPFPTSVKNKLIAIKSMRDAYEHIDNRAFGKAGQKPKLHPDALSTFNFKRLFEEGIASYGTHELEIYDEVIELMVETREYLKNATSEFASN